MKLKADEDLPRRVQTLLSAAGYDCTSVREQELGGSEDDTLWEVVQSEGRFLITGDKGFADIRSHPPGAHYGVLLLRPDDDGIEPIIELLEDVIDAYRLDDLEGAITVATPRGVRIRKREQ